MWHSGGRDVQDWDARPAVCQPHGTVQGPSTSVECIKNAKRWEAEMPRSSAEPYGGLAHRRVESAGGGLGPDPCWVILARGASCSLCKATECTGRRP